MLLRLVLWRHRRWERRDGGDCCDGVSTRAWTDVDVRSHFLLMFFFLGYGKNVRVAVVQDIANEVDVWQFLASRGEKGRW